jgi:hypothetical protein
VPDDRRIFPTLTVARNLSIARKKTRFRAWRESECFEIFSALEYLMHRECENLSGGEMQMVAISRALLGAPGLVLFDEPSQGLAPKVVQDVMKTITRLKQEGIAVLRGRAERAERARGRRPRLRDDRGCIVHEGRAARCATTRAQRAAARGLTHGTPLLASKAGQALHARLVRRRSRSRWRPTSPSTARHRRRDGPERLGQDDAVRADHRQQPADAGAVLVDGQDIHAVRYRERDRLAIHYHQSYQVRSFRAHARRS